jgi:uncharacterized oxidoreductase
MQSTGNTILITGGGSGIGRGLAEAFHKLGNEVIIAGRRKEVLDQTTCANPGMSSIPLDIDDPAAILAFAKKVVAEHPALNVLINNSGIMRLEDLVTRIWEVPPDQRRLPKMVELRDSLNSGGEAACITL